MASRKYQHERRINDVCIFLWEGSKIEAFSRVEISEAGGGGEWGMRKCSQVFHFAKARRSFDTDVNIIGDPVFHPQCPMASSDQLILQSYIDPCIPIASHRDTAETAEVGMLNHHGGNPERQGEE